MTPASERQATEREEVHACPLCAHAEAEQQDLYVHLQVNHRKSELSEALMEAIDGGEPPAAR